MRIGLPLGALARCFIPAVPARADFQGRKRALEQQHNYTTRREIGAVGGTWKRGGPGFGWPDAQPGPAADQGNAERN